MKVVELIDWKIASPQRKINSNSSLMHVSQWRVSVRVWNHEDGKRHKQNGTTNDSISGSVQRGWEGGSDRGRKRCGKRSSERVKHKREWGKKVKIMVEGRKKILWMIKPVLFDLFHSLWVLVCVCLQEWVSVQKDGRRRKREGGGRLRERRRQRSV